MKSLPNLLTGLRLLLGLVMFLCLAGAAGAIPYVSDLLTGEQQFQLEKIAFIAFVVAAVTDFFDGWLARKLNAVSVWGAILDPIGDKILICGTILGIAALGATGLGPHQMIAVPSALILFREFAVSALREEGAGRGIKLPVTLLAKWKTTLQLVAFGAQLLVVSWPAWGLSLEAPVYQPFEIFAQALLWLAAIVTVWTGLQYWAAARKALQGA
jgi:CDP-diacylglycerol--glycerol-3-phosphate 3-phosphatidyltransferase